MENDEYDPSEPSQDTAQDLPEGTEDSAEGASDYQFDDWALI